MALSENGHVAETEGNKMHHEEGIVIVGGGFRAFVLLLLSISTLSHLSFQTITMIS
jgi:hypothetical protein